MLGLTIISLKISATASEGNFSVFLPFRKGLNIIRAENSSGKSTCMNAIAYGLGLESILGPTRKRPFPKSLYEVIFTSKGKQTPFYIKNSSVILTISNEKGKNASLKRDISGDDSKVTIEIDGEQNDYFLGSSGKIGSAVSDKGFHFWLAKFIGWDLPKVVTFEDKESILYLECIFPLFFIEQKRGWSEIQANIPTQFGIKNVKKTAAEFCLSIGSFDLEKKIASHKNKMEKAETRWEKVISASEAIAEFKSVSMNKIPPIEDYTDSYGIEFYYREGDSFISVENQERALIRLIEDLSSEVSAATPENEEFNEQLTILRALRREMEKCAESLEIIMITSSETEKKISTLKHDYDQYQQLKKLKNVGSKIEKDLKTDKCPICESDLYDTLGNRTVKREPMTLQENIEFLKNQIDFFENIRNRNIDQLGQYQTQGRLLRSKIENESEKLEKMREDLDDINGATKSLIRAKIKAEIHFKEVEKLKEMLYEQKSEAKKIYNSWAIAEKSLKSLRKKANAQGQAFDLKPLEAIIKTNLSSFKFDPSAIGSISISPQTLRPEQEGYDIVADTSASDHIRIIWAYTLALMEFAGTQESIKHGCFVIFDEPRQHEASKNSFLSLIEKASDSKAYGGQVIFATSMDEAELKIACKDKDISLVCFDDYVLAQEPEPKDIEK